MDLSVLVDRVTADVCGDIYVTHSIGNAEQLEAAHHLISALKCAGIDDKTRWRLHAALTAAFLKQQEGLVVGFFDSSSYALELSMFAPDDAVIPSLFEQAGRFIGVGPSWAAVEPKLKEKNVIVDILSRYAHPETVGEETTRYDLGWSDGLGEHVEYVDFLADGSMVIHRRSMSGRHSYVLSVAPSGALEILEARGYHLT